MNSFPENDILLQARDSNKEQSKSEADSEQSFESNVFRRCYRKISSETWFVILTLIDQFVFRSRKFSCFDSRLSCDCVDSSLL